MMTSVTIVLGIGLFSFANTNASLTSGALGQAAGQTNSFLQENLKVVTVYFPASSSCPGTTSTFCVAFWLYNSGTINLQLALVHLYDTSGTVNIIFDNAGNIKDLRQGSCASSSGVTYESPALSSLTGSSSAGILPQRGQLITLTIPPSGSPPCTPAGGSSFGQTLAASGSGDTYVVIVTGLHTQQDTNYQVR